MTTKEIERIAKLNDIYGCIKALDAENERLKIENERLWQMLRKQLGIAAITDVRNQTEREDV